jgi:putative ABC transport system permease protein
MLRIPIVLGRGFNAVDKAGGSPVCLVSEAMANRFWRGQDPTTKRLRLKQFFGPGPFVRVVGVVKDIHQRNLAEAPRPLIYLPFEQAYETNMTLLARAVGEPAGVVASLRKEMTALDRDLPVPEITSLRQRVDDSTIGERENAVLMGSFGLLAVTLAATGLYAVMSYSVARRTHEIGIRMALGAGKGDVLKMVAGEAMRLALVGSLAGMAGALALTRVLRSALYRLSPADPLTFAAVAALLCVVVLVACYVPARRAMRVDPAIALRHE